MTIEECTEKLRGYGAARVEADSALRKAQNEVRRAEEHRNKLTREIEQTLAILSGLLDISITETQPIPKR